MDQLWWNAATVGMILLVLPFPLAGLGWALSFGLPRCPPTPVCCRTCIAIPSWCTHRTVLCCVGTASFKLLMSCLLICLLIPAFQPFWCAPGSWVWGNWITITVALYLCTGTGRGTRSVSRGHISFSTCGTWIFVQFSLMNNKRIFLCFSPMNNFCTKLKELWGEGNFCFADGWINIHSRNNNQVFLTAIKIFSMMGVLTYSLSPFNFL